jgi:hypothetical protein
MADERLSSIRKPHAPYWLRGKALRFMKPISDLACAGSRLGSGPAHRRPHEAGR